MVFDIHSSLIVLFWGPPEISTTDRQTKETAMLIPSIVSITCIIFGLIIMTYCSYLIKYADSPTEKNRVYDTALIGFIIFGIGASCLFSLFAESSNTSSEHTLMSGLASCFAIMIIIAAVLRILTIVIKAFKKNNSDTPE